MSDTNYQACSHLQVEDHYTGSKNTLADLMNLQKDIQENVYGFDFNKLRNSPLSEMRKFYDWNYHAIQDELRETYNALGGINDGLGNAIWKTWKKSHKESDVKKFSEMSERDLLELKYELVDIQHFLFNLMIAVGITPDELFNLYFAKNKENRERQKRGY